MKFCNSWVGVAMKSLVSPYKIFLILSFFGLVGLAMGLGAQLYWPLVIGLGLCALVGLRDFKLRFIEQMPLSQWSLIALVDAYLLSIFFNWGEYENPLWKILDVKAFIFCFFALYAFRGIFGRVGNAKKLALLFNLFLISHSVYIAMVLLGAHQPAPIYPALISVITIILLGLSFKWELSRHITHLWALFSISALSVFALVQTIDRSAIAGFVVALVVLIFLLRQTSHTVVWKKRERTPFLMALAAVILILFGAGHVLERFFPEKTQEREIREAQALAAGLAFRSAPVVGLGHSQFEEKASQIKRLQDLNYPNIQGPAPGNFLEFLATKGSLGLFALLSFMIFWGYELYQRQDILTHILLPALVGINVTGVFKYTLYEGTYLYFVLTLYALSQVQKRWVRS